MASIVVMGPPAAGVRFPLASNRPCVIGRSEFCDIVLNKRSISREHARIFEKNGEFYITDLESLNGTSVNGRPALGDTPLSDGARINLFDVPLMFYVFDEIKPPSSGSIEIANSAVNGAKRDEGSKLKLQARLDSLLDIIRRLGSSLNIDIILPKVLDILFETFPQAVTGEILLVEKNGSLSPQATKHGRDTDSTSLLTYVAPDRHLTQKVMETGLGIIDSVGDENSDSALEATFASTMYVPIVSTSRKPLGIIVLETEDPNFRFIDADLNLLKCVAIMAAQAITYANAHEMIVDYERTRYHLEAARAIQLRMLPRECPQIAAYKFAHFYQAAQMVGGDAFIYHQLSDGRVVVAVADASGKGLPASLRIVEFISEFRHCFATAGSLKAAMEYLNKHVCQMDDGFITFCVAVLDPKRHTMSIANAGHPPPRLRSRDGTIVPVESERGSLPLGFEQNADFHPLTISMNIGDEFILFTDGITEAMDPEGNLYGADRLHKALLKPAKNVTTRIEQVTGSLEEFRRGTKPSDDQCIVVVARVEA